MNEPSRQAKQKAIDGILFGDSHQQMNQPGINRERIRGMHGGPSSPQVAQQPPTARRMAPRHAQPEQPQNFYQQQALPPKEPLINIDMSDMDDLPAGKGNHKKRRKEGNIFKRSWRSLKDIKNWSLRKKIWMGILAVVVILLLLAGFLFLKGYLSAKKVFKGGGSAVSLQEEVKPDLLKGEGDGRINILLLGIGGEGHEAPDLTDTIMVASIDPVNHKTALLSVPRDLWVTVPGKGSMKINAVYETGKYAYLGKQSSSNKDQKAIEAGYQAADKMLETVLGVPIHYHALLNFQAFQQAVDSVGGIDVDVPERLYDPTMAWQNNRNPVIAEKGVQHFNGNKALMYVRSRYTTSDFARSQRQRAVIVALQQKVLTLGTFSNPQKISQLIDAFGDNVATDFSLTDLSRMYQITKGINPDSIQSVGLTDPPNDYVTTGMVGNQSVVIPKAGQGNYSAIQNYVRNTLRDGYLAKENANVMVLNGTSEPGLATAKADVLKSYGYNVGVVGDAPTQNYSKTVIVDRTNGKKPYTAQYLKKRFGVNQVTKKLPDSTIQTQNADFVIILGEDETTNSQN